MTQAPRPLDGRERALVEALAMQSALAARLLGGLDRARVVAMDDGGMGGLRFVQPGAHDRRLGARAGEAVFTDADGVPVSVTLELDQDGRLFELDLFKADNSRLIQLPAPGSLTDARSA